MIAARAVVLAAGTSSRVGKQKLLMEFRGRPLIEHAIAAAQGWNPVVVASVEVERYLRGRRDVDVVRNDAPERGMSHSLALANRAVAEGLALIVLLGDKPLVNSPLIESICNAADGADVVYAVREGVPGHPVVFSPRARRFIEELPTGDTLRSLRARPELVRRPVQTSDVGAVFDVDSTDALKE